MHRFFVPNAGLDERIRLSASEALHATRVLRLPDGEVVTLLDGEGGECLGNLEREGRNEVSVRITSRRRHPKPACEIILAQAVAKGPAMEGLLHRAVELGCHRLVPLVADRSVSRPDASGDKAARWQAIAIEAVKQSGNPWCLRVEPPLSPAAWLGRRERFDLTLVASLQAPPCHPQIRMAEFRSEQNRSPRSLVVIIGPEGDFTGAEYAAFEAAGALPFSLGPFVLRVETAATSALAIMQSLLAMP